MIYILRCSFCPPTFCKQIQCFFLKKKSDKRRKKHKEIKNNFPKLTYKDWNFFFPLPPSYLESQSTWTLKTYKKEGFLFSRDTLKLTIPLPRHCTWLNQHTSFSFKNNTSHQKKKENNKKNPQLFFFLFNPRLRHHCCLCVSTVAMNSLNTERLHNSNRQIWRCIL